MGLLIFIVVWATLWFVVETIFWKKSWKFWLLIPIFVASSIVASNSIETGCSDWWHSSSIWRQWACSRHWGVVTRMNDLWMIIFRSSLPLWFLFFRLAYREKNIWDMTDSMNLDKTNRINKKTTVIKKDPNIEIIEKAIWQGKEIGFHYKKRFWEESDRIIRPLFINVYGKTWTLCVKGFCRKWKENRNYAISGMSNIKILI